MKLIDVDWISLHHYQQQQQSMMMMTSASVSSVDGIQQSFTSDQLSSCHELQPQSSSSAQQYNSSVTGYEKFIQVKQRYVTHNLGNIPEKNFGRTWK